MGKAGGWSFGRGDTNLNQIWRARGARKGSWTGRSTRSLSPTTTKRVGGGDGCRPRWRWQTPRRSDCTEVTAVRKHKRWTHCRSGVSDVADVDRAPPATTATSSAAASDQCGKQRQRLSRESCKLGSSRGAGTQSANAVCEPTANRFTPPGIHV